MAEVWVLWWHYHDGSGAKVERVYLDEKRAREDMALVEYEGGKRWVLDTVPAFSSAPSETDA